MLKNLSYKKLPSPPSLVKLMGPSFILLGLGLGSGEIILWPYLTANYGLGIIWGAFLGITFQFFLNMEIERYALINGESVFVGFARKFKILSPIWFIFSTIIPWMWPGIIATSAVLLSYIFGFNYSPIVPIILLLSIGVILTLGPKVYKTQEALQKTLILVGIPFIILIAVYISNISDWFSLGKGIFGIGDTYFLLPKGISLASFLAAFAYAGAGGNLNLAQSFYIKEKGYGMGKYAGKITSILTGKKESYQLEGYTFEKDRVNINNFKLWWKRINLEHLTVFWATGLFTMLVLSLLSYTTVYNTGSVFEGINFLLHESSVIASKTTNLVSVIFLLVLTLMLYSTQFSVLDATSRIMSENFLISAHNKIKSKNLSLLYYIFLWTQIFLGILIFSLGFTQPLQLVILGAVLNAFSMFIYSGLIIWLNKSSFPKYLGPNLIRTIVLVIAFIFYGTFSVYTIFDYLH